MVVVVLDDFIITFNIMKNKDEISKSLIYRFCNYILSPAFKKADSFTLEAYLDIFKAFNTDDVIVELVTENVKKSL
jgi:hypothetical protein